MNGELTAEVAVVEDYAATCGCGLDIGRRNSLRWPEMVVTDEQRRDVSRCLVGVVKV